jgi:hypothetical protein
VRLTCARAAVTGIAVTPVPCSGGVTVKKKLAVILTLLVFLIATLLCASSVASARKYKAHRYRIVKHGRSYDVVRGHGKRLRVRHHWRYVKVHGVRRYKVVKRRHRSVTLRRLAPVPGNTPIAAGSAAPLGLPTSASSSQEGYLPPSGHDGLTSTRWAAGSRSYPQWWMVDLGSATVVTGVRTDWYSGTKRGAYRYRVETSLDGVTFSTAANRSKNRTKGVTSDAMSVSARYVRIQVLGSSVSTVPASVNEVAVYAADADTMPVPTPMEGPSAPDRYVSVSGSDTTGDGSAGRPWRTIQKAAISVTPGQVVSVGAGTYDERVTIPSRASGSAGATTRFVANGRVVVTQGFEIDSSYTGIEGFEITPGSTAIADVDYRGQIWVRNANVSLKRLNLHDLNRGAAICLGSSAPVANRTLIEDCTFVRIPWNAVSVDNGGSGLHPADVTLRRVNVSDFQGIEGIKAYGDRWLIEDSSVQGPSAAEMIRTNVDGDGIRVNFANGTIIRRTRIFDVWQHTPYTTSGCHTDGIQFWDSVSNLLVDGVTIGSWKPGGVDNAPGAMNSIMAGTCNSNCSLTVENSLLMSGIATGVQANAHLGCAAAQSGYTATIRLYNNTFIGNYPAWNGSNAAVSAYNNVFYSHRGGSYADASQSDCNAFLWNSWTDYAVSGGSPQASSVSSTEGARSLGKTYATRLTAAGLFVNPDVSARTAYGLNADFRPTPGSALLGAADPAHAPDHDITGAPRSATAPTIGAYE